MGKIQDEMNKYLKKAGIECLVNRLYGATIYYKQTDEVGNLKFDVCVVTDFDIVFGADSELTISIYAKYLCSSRENDADNYDFTFEYEKGKWYESGEDLEFEIVPARPAPSRKTTNRVH